jgi:hypothetical protein
MRESHESSGLATSAWPQIAPTRSSAKPCTRRRSASGSTLLSESTKARISASVALAAVGAEVDHAHARLLVRDLDHPLQRLVGRAVVDGHQLELLRRVVEREQRAQRVGDHLLLVEGRHHDRDVRLDAGVARRAVGQRQQEAARDVRDDDQAVGHQRDVAAAVAEPQPVVGDGEGEQDRQVDGGGDARSAVGEAGRRMTAGRRRRVLGSVGHVAQTRWRGPSSARR